VRAMIPLPQALERYQIRIGIPVPFPVLSRGHQNLFQSKPCGMRPFYKLLHNPP
jgi:hypothetical protein